MYVEPSSTAHPAVRKMHALTSARFFAAFLVVLFHTSFLVRPTLSHYREYYWMKACARIVSVGYVSVSFFFLLSGYILAKVYLASARPLSLPLFYRARFARVYPLFFATLILDTPYLLGERWQHYGAIQAISKTLVSFVGTTLMVHAWVPALGGIDFPNWSLGVEVFLYAVFPVVGALLWKLEGQRLLLAALLVYLVGQGMVWGASEAFSETIVSRAPLLHVPTFMVGILFARWQTQHRQSNPRIGALILFLSLLGIGSIAMLARAIPYGALNDGLLSPLFVCVIAVLSGQPTRLTSWMDARWLVLLGDASFGLYLLHIPILHLFLWAGLLRRPGEYPVYLASCLVASVASFYWFENPMRVWMLHLGRLGLSSSKFPQRTIAA